MNSRDTRDLANKFKSEAELDIGVGLAQWIDGCSEYNQLIDILNGALPFSERTSPKSLRTNAGLGNIR